MNDIKDAIENNVDGAFEDAIGKALENANDGVIEDTFDDAI